MKQLIDWRVFLPTMAVVGGVAVAGSRIFDVPLIPTFLLTVAAILANGLVATVEDDLPGGFNNPDGTTAPSPATTTVRVTKWALALALVAFGIALLASALNAGDRSDIPFAAGMSLACLLLSVALLGRNRWALWAALVSALGGIAASGFLR